jgi:hypothetical protein
MAKNAKAAQSLRNVSPTAPMTEAALIMSLAAQEGRPVTPQEISQAPAIPENATRAEYANLLDS